MCVFTGSLTGSYTGGDASETESTIMGKNASIDSDVGRSITGFKYERDLFDPHWGTSCKLV